MGSKGVEGAGVWSKQNKKNAQCNVVKKMVLLTSPSVNLAALSKTVALCWIKLTLR